MKLADCALHLGIELGLPVANIKEIFKKYKNTFSKQTLSVMKMWKNQSGDKSPKTILELVKALQLVDGSGFIFLSEKYR